MTIGLLALIGDFRTTIRATESAQENLIARHKALDAMESIYTARNSQQEPFAAINNLANGGIFLSGAQPLLCAGPMASSARRTMCPVLLPTPASLARAEWSAWCCPAPTVFWALPDDVTYSLSNFTRTITFAPTFLRAAQSIPISSP